MGLDQFALTIDEKPEKPVDFKPTNTGELFHWCKHPDLHGWMTQLYFAKGGTDPEFNCATLELTEAELKQLEADVLAKRLPKTDGCFFGQSIMEDAANDLVFIAKARKAINDGFTVVYYAWW